MIAAGARRRGIAGTAAAIALAIDPASAVAADGEAPPARAIAGAISPLAGEIDLTGEAGVIFVLPTLSASAAVGLGGGLRAELRYRNIAVLGHAGALRVSWGRRIAPSLAFGLATRTSITSLAQADGGMLGIQFSNLAIGNDWLVGGDALLTWIRPGQAQVTASIGPTFTLGGVRYSSFRDHAFRIDPAIRALTASVQGEWPIGPRLGFYLRLDADVLLRAEITPIGFIPTGVAGVAWEVSP